MARRIASTIIDTLKQGWAQDEVHFHTRAGRPEACYDRHCARPRFDAG